ncbi:TNT domain-containing protein [Saccharothrix coeruleofusca]|uniref:TNT domain-containing protein n=1 Tax=Saccharothrix coeruleofusca TaxID=33919 RepID=A0A918EES7_9PSEU|nr:TNT domain-containing protein [Saccharothrix coeruleofusca]MBP2339271.1 hypothetical protein [Saccharothrix coeruleofusca]GGP58967.1 hypothetical protein GCM10010185_34300 [Saccharothrix coeruleofusca]
MTAPQQLGLDEQNVVLGSVTTLLVHRLPGDWERLFLDLRVVGGYLEAPTSVLTIFGQSVEWELPPEALPFFLHLRQGMYDPDKGTWYSMKYQLTHPNQYSVEYEWDAEPDWTHRPPERFYLEELDSFPRPDDAIPRWLRERAGLPSPDALFEAPVFDGADAQGRPVHDRPPVHPQERDDVLAYLESAPVVLSARSFGQDALAPDAPADVPLTYHTDGTWVWSGAVAHYLRKHHVPPVPQLVQHIRDNDYRVPEVGTAAENAASAVAMGQAESAPLPEYRPPVVSEADRRALEHLRGRLEHFGVLPAEYGIGEPKPDALVVEPAPGGRGWQVQFWDANRGPQGRPRVYEHAVDAGKALLAELLWRDDMDQARGQRPAPVDASPATGPVRTVAEIQPLPDEPPLSLFRDREPVVLPVGAEIDRFGAEEGNLVYAARTMYGNRSLPPDWLNRRYHVYRVQRPVPALKGIAVPWFGQVGGGTGFFLARSVREFLADGSLVEIQEATTEPPAPQL